MDLFMKHENYQTAEEFWKIPIVVYFEWCPITASKGRTINDLGGASGREFVLIFFTQQLAVELGC